MVEKIYSVESLINHPTFRGFLPRVPSFATICVANPGLDLSPIKLEPRLLRSWENIGDKSVSEKGLDHGREGVGIGVGRHLVGFLNPNQHPIQHMIRNLRFFGLIALAAFSTGFAFGDANELPVSRTAGVVSVDLPANQTTLMALPLVEIVASGTVSSVGGVLTLASTPTALPDVLTNPHAIKITSRSNQLSGSTNAYGLSAQITGQSGQDVTAALAVAPNVGDEFVIYRLETIGSLFGAANTAGLLGAGDAGSADLVFVENGGSFTGYFYKNTSGFGTTTGWKLASGGDANQDGVVIPPNRGLLVVRKVGGSAVSITFTGDTLPGNDAASVVAGFNVVNNPFTVPTTLAGSFLEDNVTQGGDAGSADLVYVENGGILTAYFYKNTAGFGTTVGWKLASGGDVDQGSVALAPGKAILFREQAGSVGFTLPEPFAE